MRSGSRSSLPLNTGGRTAGQRRRKDEARWGGGAAAEGAVRAVCAFDVRGRGM